MSEQVSKGSNACRGQLPLWLSVMPVALLLTALIALLITDGADAINAWSPVALLSAAAVSVLSAMAWRRCRRDELWDGMRRSARQILPAVPLLALIGLVSTTWMLGGVVPTLIDYGLESLNHTFFLAIACVSCAIVSVLTGSSWTTIATVGVAFMGIGQVMGYGEGWVAGAIISGAYFGDKVSPLSDTTVVASSSCGVDLFTHIRYLMFTTLPALTVALAVFSCVGVFGCMELTAASDGELLDALHSSFNITPWVLLVPAITIGLIACRINTVLVLTVSAALGLVSMFATQPQIVEQISVVNSLLADTSIATGNARLDALVETSGLKGMLPTIELVLCAMVFGGAMIGTGMLRRVSEAFTSHLRKRTSIVGATVGSGLLLNSCTADQYLSIIIGANMYRDVYDRFGLENRLLSRTLEDSVSVTSVLIPWNSCGVTQSAVLGVSTLVYLPYCIFNYLSPVMTLLVAWTGFKIRTLATELQTR